MSSLMQPPEDASHAESDRKISPATLLEAFFLRGTVRDQLKENWTHVRCEKGRI